MTQGQYNELTWVVGGKEQLDKIRTIRNKEGLKKRVKEGNARMREKARKEKILNTNLKKQNNSLKEKLKIARRNERRSRYTFELPIKDKTPQIMKFMIWLTMFMCILIISFNGVLEVNTEKIELDTNYGVLNPEYHEIRYEDHYEKQFYDYDTKYLNRLINCAKAVEQFGKNTAWSYQLNNIQSGEYKSTNVIMVIGQVIVTPINLIMQVTGLAINEINALIGKPLIKIPSLFYRREITPQGERFMNWFSDFVSFNWFK